MHQIRDIKSITNCKVCFYANKFEWYKVIILSAYISGIANNAVSLPGIAVNLNNKESNIIYFSASASTLFIFCCLFNW